jgi:hypothetical protein
LIVGPVGVGDELGVGVADPLGLAVDEELLDGVGLLEGLAWARMRTEPNEGPTTTKMAMKAAIRLKEIRASRRGFPVLARPPTSAFTHTS